MDPNRDSRQAETGRISFEDWTRITAACTARPAADPTGKSARHVRRLMAPLVPITATLCAAAAVVAAIMLWQ